MKNCRCLHRANTRILFEEVFDFEEPLKEIPGPGNPQGKIKQGVNQGEGDRVLSGNCRGPTRCMNDVELLMSNLF